MIVNVSPELETRLAQIAMARGLSVPDAAGVLLEEKILAESAASLVLSDHDGDLFLQSLDTLESPHPNLMQAAQRYRNHFANATSQP